MNTATKNLENDHVHILRLIDVMEKMVMAISTDTAHIETVISLIKNYADGYHHSKEENLLFPLLVKKGFSKEQGPVAVMLHEHVEGRNFLKGMKTAVTAYKNGDDSALSEIYSNMQGYIDLLRAHIGKENNVLFRMADKALSPEEQLDLLNAFAALEMTVYTNGHITEYLVEIEELEAIYKGD